jgi:hypothetical protein
MHELLERLGRGDTHLIEMCQTANRAWRAFLEEMNGADTGTLAARLGFFQPSVERIFESLTLGQTMMPWSGFAVPLRHAARLGVQHPTRPPIGRSVRDQQLQQGSEGRGAVVRHLL